LVETDSGFGFRKISSHENSTENRNPNGGPLFAFCKPLRKRSEKDFFDQDVLSFRAVILLGVFRKTLNPLFMGTRGQRRQRLSNSALCVREKKLHFSRTVTRAAGVHSKSDYPLPPHNWPNIENEERTSFARKCNKLQESKTIF